MSSTAVNPDFDELVRRVNVTASEVAKFVWEDLAARLPFGHTYVRPEGEGPYMAIVWEADWFGREGGPIAVEINGFLEPEHHELAYGLGELIHKRSFLARLFARK